MGRGRPGDSPPGRKALDGCQEPAEAPTPRDGRIAAAAGLVAMTRSHAQGIDLRVLNASRSKFQACAGLAWQYKPGLHGDITLELEVAPNGNVASVTAYEDTVGDPRFPSCILGMYHGLRLAEVGEARTVHFIQTLSSLAVIRTSKRRYHTSRR